MQQEKRLMDSAAAAAFHLQGWASIMALAALGPVYGLRGAPRGLYEASLAAGAMAWIRDQGWGPAASRVRQRDAWTLLR
eukprot:15242171-Alexandrium_andersonii.AAC.1